MRWNKDAWRNPSELATAVLPSSQLILFHYIKESLHRFSVDILIWNSNLFIYFCGCVVFLVVLYFPCSFMYAHNSRSASISSSAALWMIFLTSRTIVVFLEIVLFFFPCSCSSWFFPVVSLLTPQPPSSPVFARYCRQNLIPQRIS